MIFRLLQFLLLLLILLILMSLFIFFFLMNNNLLVLLFLDLLIFLLNRFIDILKDILFYVDNRYCCCKHIYIPSFFMFFLSFIYCNKVIVFLNLFCGLLISKVYNLLIVLLLLLIILFMNTIYFWFL